MSQVDFQRGFGRIAAITLVTALVWLAAACQPSGDNGGATVSAPSVASAGVDAYLPLELGAQEIFAQIAITPPEQRRGLMFRESLPAHSGMLFLYGEPRAMGFWMKNTRIDLDIGFFDADGVLLEVHTMIAGDLETTRSRSDSVQYALEMERGWFVANGVRPGAQLNLQSLAAAVRARGYPPGRFGLPD